MNIFPNSRQRMNHRHRANLLPNLLCLLLIFGSPIMAQSTCDTNYSLPIAGANPAPTGECATVTTGLTWDSRTLSERNIKKEFEAYATPGCEVLPPAMRSGGKFFNTFLFGSSPHPDQGPTHTIGVDPATLRPEALDLEIFPSIPISDQLSLKPSLSYSEDVCMARLGRVDYSPPKQWRNHYGELVVMLAGTFQSKVPINQLEFMGQASGPNNPLSPEVREIQLFYVNANGQQINFYPDPATFPNAGDQGENPDKPTGRIHYWYSSEGNYRLEDKNYDSTTSDHFDFELKTPDGLAFHFELYNHDLDVDRESMVIRFRTEKIEDRHGNYLSVSYKNFGGIKDLRPDKVEGYSNNDALLHTLNYTYLADGRLSTIDLPGYGGNTVRNTYQFFYPDNGTIQNGLPGRHELNNVANAPVTLVQDGAIWRAQIPALATNLTGYARTLNNDVLNEPSLFLNFDDLGFAPEPMLDFNTFTDTEIPDFSPSGYGFRYQFPKTNPTAEGFFQANTFSRQGKRFRSRFEGTIGLAYRYQIDEYPNHASFNESLYPDYVDLDATEVVGSPFPNQQEVLYDIFPMLKDGDAIVWKDTNNQLKFLEVDLVDSDPFDPTSYAVRLRGSDDPSQGVNFQLIREDNRNRITEIAFPTSTGSSHKRMLLKYDDFSVNHQEIEQVQLFDVSANDALLLTETTYTYEHALIQSLSQDMDEVLPIPGIVPDLWRNCDPSRPYSEIGIGVNLLGRHELTPMMRQKTTRYLKHWRALGDAVTTGDYQTLTTYYGGAYRFDLMTRGAYTEGTSATDLKTCDFMEWGVAAKPFSFTWQIHPDGTGTVFDLSPRGLGLEPALAHANRYRRVFKTYEFDHRFKDLFVEENGNNPPFKSFTQSSTAYPFTPTYHYLPGYVISGSCSGCASPPTTADLAANPPLPTLQAPTMSQIFGGAGKCFGANWTTFELVPIHNYAIDTDATHGSRFLRRWTIKALFGALETVDVSPTKRYMRLSPAQTIDLEASTPTEASDLVEKFFRGDLETCASYGVPATSLGTIKWTYGGRIDFGSVFHYYHDRQKTHKLVPHSQIQAQNLNGFTWDPNGFLNLSLSSDQSPYVVQATRSSNGGYLGSATVSSTVTQGNSLTLGSPFETLSVNVGDIFFYEHFLYSITAINGNTVTFSPDLKQAVPAAQKLPFHRFFRGKFPDTQTEPNNGYLGYDAFGNNAFQAVYKKDTLFFPSPTADADHALVPDFFYDQNGKKATPYQIAMTDATASGNNDSANWTYFGRVGKRFEGHALGFYDHSTSSPALVQGWQQGQWTTWAFDGAPYDWTPHHQVSWYQPKDLSANFPSGMPNDFSVNEFAALAIPGTAHAEDEHRFFKYYAPTSQVHAFSTSNSLAHGRVAITWSGRAATINPDHVRAQRFDYDARGRVSATFEAAFSLESSTWTSPYGTITSNDYAIGGSDSLMDLPSKTTISKMKPTWNPSGSTVSGQFGFSSQIEESASHNTFDELGRVLTNYSTDAAGLVFGEITDMSYPTQTKEVVGTKKPSGASPFTQTTTYRDGRGELLANFRQRGGAPNLAFMQAQSYDAFGRPSAAGYDREVNVNQGLDALAKTADPTLGAYTETVYNHRNEPFGQVVHYLDSGNNQSVESSRWTHLSQDTSGNLVTQLLQQMHDETVPSSGLPDLEYVAVKTIIQSDHGMVDQVRDDRITPSSTMSAVWTAADITGESALAQYLPNLVSTPLTSAVYTYDRFGNVGQAEVGASSATQIREFHYDQRNRLRLEKHPEIRADNQTPISEVTYQNFDLFDQPGTVSHGPGRTWNYTYNAAGDLMSMTAGAITTAYSYRYGIGSSAITFPGLPVLVRHTEDGEVAYLSQYDDDRGWLTDRTMFHDDIHFDGFGYVASLPSQDDTYLLNHIGEGLTLTYEIDDLGRIEAMTYPSPIQGQTNPTKLAFTFDSSHELLTRIEDQAFPFPYLPLVDGIQYDRMDAISQANLIQASTGSPTHQITRQPDSLGRMSNWGALWEETTTQLDETRTYLYDHGGHLAEISANGQPLYRYAYDVLGQIKQAWIKPGTTAQTHTFTYDPDGFGNLIGIDRSGSVTNFSADPATNHLTEFTYNQFGEQETDIQNGVTYDLSYNAMGRLSTYDTDAQGDNTLSQYHYDDAGMRVHVAETDAGGAQTERLYFYDENGMVLCEWQASEGATTWTTHWDKSYLYLEGKTLYTYEYDAASSGVPTSPGLAQPEILQDGLLTWEETTAPYEVEIADDRDRLVRQFSGLQANGLDLSTRLKFGKYHVRIRGNGATWGDWQDIYYMDAASQDLAGEYGFDRSGDDSSHYANHIGDLDGIGFTFGQYFDALDMDAGETFTIENPHQFQPPGNLGTLSIWLKIPIPDQFAPFERRKLWDRWHIALWVGNDGTIEIKPKGKAYQSASLSITPGSWSHLAVVYGDSTARVYVDGQLGLDATNITPSFGQGDMNFGNINNGFEGLLDRIRIFNRALTSTEIQSEATP